MKQLTNRNLIIINFSIVLYFLLLWLIAHYEIHHVLIGVFSELLTMPFLIAQIIFLFLSIKYLINNEIRILLVGSILLLLICSTLTIGSLF